MRYMRLMVVPLVMAGAALGQVDDAAKKAELEKAIAAAMAAQQREVGVEGPKVTVTMVKRAVGVNAVPATAPDDKGVATTQEAHPLTEKIDAMPAELRYAAGEPKERGEAREKWWNANAKKGTEAWTFKGKVVSVEAGKEGRAKVTVDWLPRTVLGKKLSQAVIVAELENVTAAEAGEWKAGTAVTIKGVVRQCSMDSQQTFGDTDVLRVWLTGAKKE